MFFCILGTKITDVSRKDTKKEYVYRCLSVKK